MSLFNQTLPKASISLRVLARLLGYPDVQLRSDLADMRIALHNEQAVAPQRLAELDALIDLLARKPPLELEADYVELFDRGRYVTAFVRACAWRFARPRAGHDRPGADLRQSRHVPGRGRNARLFAGGARVHLDPAAARGARISG